MNKEYIDPELEYKKLNKYVSDFLEACNTFIEKNRFYKDAKEEFILIEPEKFKLSLKNFCIGDENECLKVYRDLSLIVTEQNRFTIRRKIEGEYKRFIAVRIVTLDRLKELTKEC